MYNTSLYHVPLCCYSAIAQLVLKIYLYTFSGVVPQHTSMMIMRYLYWPITFTVPILMYVVVNT